jgi:predicted dehydrogenase
MSNLINRREFIQRTAVSGAAIVTAAPLVPSIAAANDQIVVGVVGMSRGRALAQTFASTAGCTVKYVCDTDAKRLEAGAADVAKTANKPPQPVGDFRQILDDAEVDAMVFALPVHWHAPAAIMACTAGKHVYVEKPCCHNPAEGELLVAAARKYNRCVQMGTQRRSSLVLQEAIQKLHEGAIGSCYFARSWYAALRGTIGHGQETDVPDGLNYDLWQGPAPRRPYKDNVLHYNWHWLWHWGTGELGNNGTHVLDLCRWGLEVDYPSRVTAAGGRYRYADDQETPDTHSVSYDFGGAKTITWEGLSCNQPGAGGNGFGATFYGEKGSLTLGSTNYSLKDEQGQVVEEKSGDLGGNEHVDNFLNAIRENKPESLNAEIETGYKSTLMSHLGNIAYRTGDTLLCDESGHIVGNPSATALWKRDYEPGWEPKI